MSTWYYAGVDKTGHKCPYCCDAFVSSGATCDLFCSSSATPAWTCIPPPFGGDCFVYRKDSASIPFSVSIVWNSWYFGSSQNLSCYPSSTTPPCVNSAGWSVENSSGGGCSGVAYGGVGGCASTAGCTGCSQTTASIRTACSAPDMQSCEDGGCYTYTGVNTWLPYCRGCTGCSYSVATQCGASCNDAEPDCYSVCHPACDDPGGGCPPGYECIAGICEPPTCSPVTGDVNCGPCYYLTCTEDESGDIGSCVMSTPPTCDGNHYSACTCLGWECLCNSGYSACCTETNPSGMTEGMTGWTNVSHGRCRPCFWPYVDSGSDCCSRSSGAYAQKNCSSGTDACCPDGRCYPSTTVLCRYDMTTVSSNAYLPCGNAVELTL